jgi:hypothetical protein
MDGGSTGCGCCGCFFALLLLPLILLVVFVVILIVGLAANGTGWHHFNQLIPSMVSLLPL